MSIVTYSSPKIAKAFCQRFGNEVKSVQIEMKHEEVVGLFIKRVENAQRLTAKSKTRFK